MIDKRAVWVILPKYTQTAMNREIAGDSPVTFGEYVR